jgi:ribosome-binding protein aMBF1 (putative translation factor)
VSSYQVSVNGTGLGLLRECVHEARQQRLAQRQTLQVQLEEAAQALRQLEQQRAELDSEQRRLSDLLLVLEQVGQAG